MQQNLGVHCQVFWEVLFQGKRINERVTGHKTPSFFSSKIFSGLLVYNTHWKKTIELFTKQQNLRPVHFQSICRLQNKCR